MTECVSLMREADERGVPLYVNNGFPTALKFDFPGIFAMLQDQAVFERVAYLTGTDVMVDRVVHAIDPKESSELVLSAKRIEASHQDLRRLEGREK